MSGIYKSLQPKDVRSTPYRAHKDIVAAFDGNEESTECKVYVAEHSLSSSYNFSQQGISNLDYGNSYYESAFATTTDGYYKTAIHGQLDHLFFREYLSNNKATLGGGASIGYQYRDLGTKARVVSFPTKKIGEGILQESLQITASGYTITDDKKGNLVFASGGSNGITSYDAADYDNAMLSYTFNQYYKYASEGVVPVIQQDTSYGSYKLHATYNNVAFAEANTSGSIEAIFSPTTTSSLKLAGGTNEMKDIYNMQNRDYAIAMKIKLSATPSSNVVLLAKQDISEDYAVDIEGQLFVDREAPTQFPYKIEIDSSRKLVVSKSNRVTTISTGSATAFTLDTNYDIVVQRTGSNFELWVNGTRETVMSDTFYKLASVGTNKNSEEKDCVNQSNLYVGNDYKGTSGFNGSLTYMHIFDRSLSSNEILNLKENSGSLNNYCGNVFYNLGLVVLTHPKLVNAKLTQIKTKSTVSLREKEVYCTVGPGDFNVTYNRSVHYWNPVHDRYEVDSRYTGSLFRPYVTTVGLYNDKNELLAVGKLSTPIQTSRNTDTTFILRFDF